MARSVAEIHADRVYLHQEISRTASELACVRYANRTQPETPIEWLALIGDRMLELTETMIGRTDLDFEDVDRGVLVGVAADVQGFLEAIASELAE